MIGCFFKKKNRIFEISKAQTPKERELWKKTRKESQSAQRNPTRSPTGPCSLSSNSPATSTPTGSPTFTSTTFYDRILEAKGRWKLWSEMERVCDWPQEKKSCEGESLPKEASRTKVAQEGTERRRIRMHPSTSVTPLTRLWRAAGAAASARRPTLPPTPSPCCGQPGCTVPATQTDRHQVGAHDSILLAWSKNTHLKCPDEDPAVELKRRFNNEIYYFHNFFNLKSAF